MANQSIESVPAGSIIAIVDDPCGAERILRWTQAEAWRLGCEAAVVFAPAFVELAPLNSGPGFQRAAGEVAAIVDRLDGHCPGGLPFIAPPKSSIARLRAQLLLRDPRLLVVGSEAEPALAELLFGSHGPGGPPVALVPAAHNETNSPGASRLLTVGFHDTDTAVKALRWAVTEAERTDARVRAVVVWLEDQLGRLSGGMVVSSHRCALPGRTAKQTGALALANSGVPLNRVCSVMARGSPASTLVREAASSDLLVVGASPTRVHSHPVLGPTTAGCLRETVVPIVVVPGR